MKKVAFLSAVSLLTVSGVGWAGLAATRETQVDLVARKASGSLYDSRASADAVQYIGCMVFAAPPALPSVSCDARDAQSERLTCTSSDAGLVSLAAGVSDSSFVSFACDANATLTSLVVNNSSVWLP